MALVALVASALNTGEENMELLRIDLEAGAIVDDQPPYASGFAAVLPPETLADLTDRGYPGVGYWPVVEVQPEYDPATQMLGAESLTVDVPGQRVVQTWTVEAIPVMPPALPDWVARKSAKLVLLKYGYLARLDTYFETLAEPDRTIAFIQLDDSEVYHRLDLFVAQMCAVLGINDAARDALFIEAAGGN